MIPVVSGVAIQRLGPSDNIDQSFRMALGSGEARLITSVHTVIVPELPLLRAVTVVIENWDEQPARSTLM